MHQIESAEKLLSIDNIIKTSQSLAILDAIIMPEWEFRYFSFDSKWDSNEMMASMRNGEGGEYFLLFCPFGVVGKIYVDEVVSDSDRILSLIPDSFSSFTGEPAFKLNKISCCIWRTSSDSVWHVEPPLDIGVPLMRYIADREKYYYDWAVEYYEKDLDFYAIRSVFCYKPLDITLLKRINSDVSLDDIWDDINVIGYPLSL